MNWRTIAGSVIGTSHIANGTDCQDYCFVQIKESLFKSNLLCIFVADGAGSALHGGVGAKLAVEVANDFIDIQYQNQDFQLNKETAIECVKTIRSYISMVADEQKVILRDYACTFLCAMVNEHQTLVFQIGDGGIVVDIGNDLILTIKPMTGEYANMTNFVTDEDALSRLEANLYPFSANRLAVFTDGLQRLALDLTTNTAHKPFFTPFFNALASVETEKLKQLQDALINFLNSKSLNDRTDDDKTLVLAVQVE